MNRKLISKVFRASFLISILVVGASAWAGGTGAGNGGDALVCRKADGSIDYVQFFDLYETESVYGRVIDLGSSTLDPLAKIQVISARNSEIFPNLMKSLTEHARTFLDRAIFTNDDLVDIPDSGDILLPVGCKIEQLIIRSKQLPDPKKLFLINRPLWDRLDSNSKTAAITHEFFYGRAVDLFKHIDSSRSRYLNGLFLANYQPDQAYLSWVRIFQKVGHDFEEDWGCLLDRPDCKNKILISESAKYIKLGAYTKQEHMFRTADFGDVTLGVYPGHENDDETILDEYQIAYPKLPTAGALTLPQFCQGSVVRSHAFANDFLSATATGFFRRDGWCSDADLDSSIPSYNIQVTDAKLLKFQSPETIPDLGPDPKITYLAFKGNDQAIVSGAGIDSSGKNTTLGVVSSLFQTNYEGSGPFQITLEGKGFRISQELNPFRAYSKLSWVYGTTAFTVSSGNFELNALGGELSVSGYVYSDSHSGMGKAVVGILPVADFGTVRLFNIPFSGIKFTKTPTVHLSSVVVSGDGFEIDDPSGAKFHVTPDAVVSEPDDTSQTTTGYSVHSGGGIRTYVDVLALPGFSAEFLRQLDGLISEAPGKFTLPYSERFQVLDHHPAPWFNSISTLTEDGRHSKQVSVDEFFGQQRIQPLYDQTLFLDLTQANPILNKCSSVVFPAYEIGNGKTKMRFTAEGASHSGVTEFDEPRKFGGPKFEFDFCFSKAGYVLTDLKPYTASSN